MNGKKRICKAGAICLAAAFLLGSCHVKGKEPAEPTQSGEANAETEFFFLEEVNASDETKPSESEKPLEEGYESETEIRYGDWLTAWNDNTTDDYQAVMKQPLKKIKVEGDLSGAGAVFVCENGCARQGMHTFSSYKEDWSGANGITADGREYEIKIMVDPERVGRQIDLLAPISGRDGYVASFSERGANGKQIKYWFYVLDANYQVIRSVQANMAEGRQIDRLLGDGEGNFHVICEDKSKKAYAVISPEGEVLFEKEVTAVVSELRAFGGGRVLLEETENGQQAAVIRQGEANLGTGTFSELPVFQDETIKKKMAEYVYFVMPIDEWRLVWCAKEGILSYDSTSKELKTLYRWSNHGIVPNWVNDLTITNEGSIEMLYVDENEDGLSYLKLEPTKEKKEIKSITFAVRPGNKEKFEQAAAFFQKKYPDYVIVVKDDYDETNLLTQLGAGDGPVLVDTSLTGFEELEKLWQPLDGFLEQAGLLDEIIPETLELGKIGGVTYGIVRDFQIQTLLIRDSGPRDWDYGGFLQALEDFDGATLTNRYVQSSADLRYRYFDILKNGYEDNYYFSANSGKTIFGTAEFERVVSLSKKALRCPPAEEGKALREGEVLCECGWVPSIMTAFKLRRRLEANGERAIGYPTKNGARHRLEAISPIAIRNTATQEDKQIAYTFLKVYLSKEAMETHDIFLPVRKDVLEDLFMEYQETVENEKLRGEYNPNSMPEIDWEKDVEFLYGLIRNSIAQRSFPTGLEQIFDEEFDDYLEGRIDGNALSNHVEKRVNLYLMEQK